MGTKQLNRFDESLLPRHQIIAIKTKRENEMGCRLKEVVYLSCLLLLAVGVWFSYSQPGQDAGDPWPWAEESVETSRDLLHNSDYDGYQSEEANYEDDGNRGFDEEDDGQFDEDLRQPSNAKALFSEDLSEDRGTSAQHQDDAEYNVPYNEKLIDLRVEEYIQEQGPPADQVLPAEQPVAVLQEYTVKDPEGGLVGDGREKQLMSMPDAGNVEQPTYDAAAEILKNHADRAKELGIPPGGISYYDDSKTTNLEPRLDVVAEKYKPNIVLSSADGRQTRELSADQPKIPRIIHQSWQTTDVPVSFAPWIQSWLKKNPNWEYWFWTQDDVEELIRKDYPTFVDLLRPDAISVEDRANVMRYFIIHAHGGLYAELDMECLNSMDSWVFSHDCFLAEETREHSYLVHNKLQGNVINAMMACKAHHPFYEVIIHALPDYLFRYKGIPSHASGSFFLNDIYQAFRKHPLPAELSEYGDVALIEPDYFTPRYDERHWKAIDEACNRNIIDMPFHVSWLCTLWLRKRMHENQPYKHSYTDHHWIDTAEMGAENINTVSVISLIRDVLASRQHTDAESPSTGSGILLPTGNTVGVAQEEQRQLPLTPQDIVQTGQETGYLKSDDQQQLPLIPNEFAPQQEPSYSLLPSGRIQDSVQEGQSQFPVSPQDIPQTQQGTTADEQQLPIIPQELPAGVPEMPPVPQHNQAQPSLIPQEFQQLPLQQQPLQQQPQQPLQQQPQQPLQQQPQQPLQEQPLQEQPQQPLQQQPQQPLQEQPQQPLQEQPQQTLQQHPLQQQPQQPLQEQPQQPLQEQPQQPLQQQPQTLQDNQYRLSDILKPQDQSQNLGDYNNIPQGQDRNPQYPVQTSADQRPDPASHSASSLTNTATGLLPDSGYPALPVSQQPQQSYLPTVQNPERNEQHYALNDYSQNAPTWNSGNSIDSSVNSQNQPAGAPQTAMENIKNQINLYDVLKQGVNNARPQSSSQYEQLPENDNNVPAVSSNSELAKPLYQ